MPWELQDSEFWLWVCKDCYCLGAKQDTEKLSIQREKKHGKPLTHTTIQLHYLNGKVTTKETKW